MADIRLMWFRRDLRLQDNPAWREAGRAGAAVIPVYIHDPGDDDRWTAGAASRVWLHHSLLHLAGEIGKSGTKLIIRQGKPGAVLRELIRETNAAAVYWNRLYEPEAIRRDSRIKKELKKNGTGVETFNAALLNEPDMVHNKQGDPFRVFTPFWRHCQTREPVRETAVAVHKAPAPEKTPQTVAVAELGLLPEKPGWHVSIEESWQPGYRNALKQLRRFIRSGLEEYSEWRDFPAMEGVSRLSPCLHFGEIGPRQIWHEVHDAARSAGKLSPSKKAADFIRQLYWREFAHHLLYHYPETPLTPLYEKYRKFPWRRNKAELGCWQRGETGYPLVDAGMRELWSSGWMHNRVRMITGSFLVKDLLLHWRHGAEWFWDTLVDADLANNTLGWQWVAGCGADAAPYFRIFNPVTQSEKFDPEGDYLRRWLPELGGLDNRTIHKPWQAEPAVLKKAGIILGSDYPAPMVDHGVARKRALAALEKTKN